MHELGIVFHIIQSVERIAVEHKAGHINSVTLEIGEVSTVIPSYLEDCWKWAVERSELMKGCVLKYERLPAVTLCESCNKTYATVSHGIVCPYCLSANTHLVSGNEVNIKEIEVV